jgi:hypothetical protein
MSELIHSQAVILETRHSPYARLKPVSISNIFLDEGFWYPGFKLTRQLHYTLNICCINRQAG